MGSDQQVLLAECIFVHREGDVGGATDPPECAAIVGIEVNLGIVIRNRPAKSAPGATGFCEIIVPSICVIHRETAERRRCRGCRRKVHLSCAGLLIIHGVFAYLYSQEAWARCWLYRYWHGIVIVPASGEGNDGHDEE